MVCRFLGQVLQERFSMRGGDITSVKYEVEEFQKEFCIGGVKVGEHGV